MSFKPFKAPSFKRPESTIEAEPKYQKTSSTKRQRLSPEPQDGPANDSNTAPKQATPVIARTALRTIKNPPSPERVQSDQYGARYFSVVWRKVTAKKNKTWEEDGVVMYRNGLVSVFNSKGHKIGTTVRDRGLEIDDIFSTSGKDVQVEADIKREEFMRIVNKSGNDSKSNEKPQAVIPSKIATPKMSLQEKMRQQIQDKSQDKSKSKGVLIPASRNAAFRNPLKDSQVLPQIPSEIPIPRHDISAPNALIFKRPKQSALPAGKQIVDVVLDPLLTAKLRDHQREGVQFLYECVMGLRNFNGQGCILADDMGLGKTLQTIALIWTLLKQNPIHKTAPVIKKVLIVCPVTLTMNWKREFRKWLGRDRIGVMCFGDEGGRLRMFDGRNFQVMIVGYERLTKIAEDLTQGTPIDLVICDEGHRLKTLQNKAAKAVATLNTPRRIILSGTPIQNDLNEFFAMVNFVNDGVLGSAKAFIKDFERPILRSRQPNATEDDMEKGRDASEELAQTTSPFILRRTADILADHLPPKTEYVLFCKPTKDQAHVYREVLNTAMFKSAMGGNSNESPLQMITILKKLCNSPSLLKPSEGADDATPSTSLQTLNEMMPRGLARLYTNSYSSKIRLLDQLLQEIKRTGDKVVLVSNYTSTLDLMQNVVTSSNMNFKRLDGTVNGKKRLALVEEFNKAPQQACFAFLLSAKAGGVGINLIGANRLILFDVDWNPAVEDQAMARIHREGQKKSCYIYRFLIKGAIEERIWQRQVVKRGLADSIMEGGPAPSDGGKKKGQAAFSAEELRDLFRLDETEGLRTHDLIDCDCQHRSAANNPEGHHSNSESDKSESEDETPVQTFLLTPASQVNDELLEEQERSIRRGTSPRKSPKQDKKESKELQELLTYTHIDTASVSRMNEAERGDLDLIVNDECLTNTLTAGSGDMPGNIAFVFLKKSKTTVTEGDVEHDNDEDVINV